MTITEICKKAESVASQFNPEGIAPFPFEKISKEYKDLRILTPAIMPDENSGAITYIDGIYYIFVNKSKPEKRQYFTIAHELGHYFLHKDYLHKYAIVDEDSSSTLEGSGILYRPDETDGLGSNKKRLETEANNFAASLIMPEKLVRQAWEVTDKNIESCAEIFKVSTVAMSVRLERLGLVA